MKVEKKGDDLIITVPINGDRPVSKSGKSLGIASSNGNIKTGIKIDGGEVTVGFNAYIPNPNYKKQ